MPVILGKCLQTSVEEPALVWPVKKTGKYLVLSAHPRRHGPEIVAEKPSTANAAGNLASLCRTWGESLFLSAIWHDADSRTWWLPFGSDGENPRACARLTGGSAPEITLVECAPEPCVRMRLSTGGIFTKRRPLDFTLPHQMSGSERASLRDILPELLAAVVDHVRDEAIDEVPQLGEPDDLLPLYQREARDRLARRLKTLRKSIQKEERHKPIESAVEAARTDAHRLRAEGRGREMDAAFKELKRLEKSLQEAGQRSAKLRGAVLDMESDLTRLRARAMGEDEVTAILRHHGLKPRADSNGQVKVKGRVKSKVKSKVKAARPVASDWHDFKLKDGTRLMVGKGAEESDRLVKAAAANDWWLHVVGSTGSHVIVPARQFKGQTELPPAVLRAAGILAIHYSKLRGGCAGEVYVSRKGNLRKRKGDPAGLWQIERSGSVMIRYDAAELAVLFEGNA